MRIHTVTARVNAAGDISTARWKISARREQQTTIRQALYPADARFSGAPVHRLGPTAVPGGAPLAFAPRTREDGFDVCTPRGRRGVGVRRADARALPRALDARRARRGHDAALFRSRSSARAGGARLRLRARRRRRREPLPRPRTRDRAPPRPRSGRRPRGVEEEAHAGGARGGRARREARERREAEEAELAAFEAEEAARREAGEDDADLDPADLDSDAGARAWEDAEASEEALLEEDEAEDDLASAAAAPARATRSADDLPRPASARSRSSYRSSRSAPPPEPEPGIDPVLVGAGALAVAAVGYFVYQKKSAGGRSAAPRPRGAPTRVPTSRARTAPAAGAG